MRTLLSSVLRAGCVLKKPVNSRLHPRVTQKAPASWEDGPINASTESF